ncbi:hypothetical protein [Actinoplanes sp. NPDC051859]|uniref:hypothetical protein n=1 Tax=Actinoplanes sp. NPDC051859 TaxID=3363909 RepID=UPI0037BC2343
MSAPEPGRPSSPGEDTVIEGVVVERTAGPGQDREASATADEIAQRVLGVPGVVRLHAGALGEVATYLPGRRVTGVKLGTSLVEVHVVVSARAPLHPVARTIHAAVAEVVSLPVHVYIEDVVAPAA